LETFNFFETTFQEEAWTRNQEKDDKKWANAKEEMLFFASAITLTNN